MGGVRGGGSEGGSEGGGVLTHTMPSHITHPYHPLTEVEHVLPVHRIERPAPRPLKHPQQRPRPPVQHVDGGTARCGDHGAVIGHRWRGVDQVTHGEGEADLGGVRG